MTGTTRMDPRDFIMRPFLVCPKCGAEQFGVLNVRGSHCKRRCRACWYTADAYLPEIRKRVIYIDQFAFSNIMKTLSPDVKGHTRAKSEPFWLALFETLSVACHLQLVVCPDSKEHQSESLTSSFYKDLKRTYEHFSGGVSFYRSEAVRLRQIARLAQCWLSKEPVTYDFDAERITHGKLHVWADRIYVTVDGVLPGLANELRAARTRTQEGLREVFEFWQQEKKSFEEIFALEKAAYSQSLVKLYISQMGRVATKLRLGEMPHLNDLLPSEAQMILEQVRFIFERTLGSTQWIAVASEFVASGAMNEAPFNVIGASMFASLAQKAASGQRRPPNQGMANDVAVVSTLLPYCDAMFVDNECRALWQDIPKTHKLSYPCALFSPNIGEDFLHYLEAIRDSATPEHLKLVSEVYGADPLKPPQSIHGVGKRDN